MVKNALIALVIVGSTVITYFFFFKKSSPSGKIIVNIKNQPFDLEIARSLSEKSRGLSGRNSLCNHCGMIFVYGQEGIYPFWMKDTLIPLDIIWMDQEGRVVTIYTAHPQPDTSLTQLKTYRNSDPAQYIIELNAGKSNEIGLNIGDIVNLPNFDQ